MAQEQVKNTALSGSELRDVSVHLLRTQLTLHGVLTDAQIIRVSECFLRDMNNDYVFSPQFTYPMAELDMGFQLHVIEDRWAFTLTPEYYFTNPALAKHIVFIHRPLTVPKPPLSYSLDDEHVVDCFRLKMKVDNPNLVRIHMGIPITVTRTVMPDRAKNRPMVTFEVEEVRYDPKDYDPLPPPVLVDESRAYATEWGLKGAKVEYPAEEAHAWETQAPVPVSDETAELVANLARSSPEDFEQMMRARKRAALIGSGIELTDEERFAAEKAAGLHFPVETQPAPPPAVFPHTKVVEDPAKKKAKKRSRT